MVLAIATSCAAEGVSAPEAPLRSGDGSGSSAVATTSTEPAVEESDRNASVSVDLILPGAEPRRELRLQPEVGATQRVTTRTDVQQIVDLPDGTYDESMPVYEMDEVRTVTATDAGEIRVEVAPFDYRIVDDRDLWPELIEEIEGSFERIVALGATTFTVDEQAQVIATTALGEAAMYDITGFDASAAVDSSIPFPAEEIGIGAHWRVNTVATIDGIRTEIVTDLRLTELDDTRAVATYTQAITMPPGFIEGTFDRDEILGGSFDSTGTITWHLDHALPLISQSGTGTIRMRSFQGASSATVVVNQQIATSMTLKESS